MLLGEGCITLPIDNVNEVAPAIDEVYGGSWIQLYSGKVLIGRIRI